MQSAGSSIFSSFSPAFKILQETECQYLMAYVM